MAIKNRLNHCKLYVYGVQLKNGIIGINNFYRTFSKINQLCKKVKQTIICVTIKFREYISSTIFLLEKP